MKQDLELRTESADVLVIGAGMAGMVAAMRAREAGAEVICVDKGTAGFAGQIPTGGGMGFVMESEAEAQKWVEWEVGEGGYLNDQEWTEIFVTEGYRRFAEMAQWSCPIHLEPDGRIRLYPREKTYKILLFEARKMLVSLKKRAVGLGVRFADRINVVQLIKDGERVAGAVGFDLDTGDFRVFTAKETIIAHGSCNYKIRKLFTVNCGEGVMAAYDAGAEMRNAEFGNSYGYVVKYYDTFGRGHSYNFFVNNRGEKLINMYDISMVQDINHKVVYAMGNEVRQGRGPILQDLTQATEQEIFSIRGETRYELNVWAVLPRLNIDPIKEKVEWVAVLVGKQGAIRVDTSCRTTLQGLWAAGDAVSLGSSWFGAMAPGNMPGLGIPFGVVSGWRAGEFAGRSAAGSPPPRAIDRKELLRVKEELYGPMNRRSGKDPGEAIYKIQEVIHPLKYNFFRTEDRLKEGLQKILDVKASLDDLYAADPHYLGRCHQARAMTACAEMTFRAALLRTETRAGHYREDYPNRDDRNWLKWIIIQKKNGEMALATEEVPINKYRYKPTGA